jgi:hypothetical protein
MENDLCGTFFLGAPYQGDVFIVFCVQNLHNLPTANYQGLMLQNLLNIQTLYVSNLELSKGINI